MCTRVRHIIFSSLCMFETFCNKKVDTFKKLKRSAKCQYLEMNLTLTSPSSIPGVGGALVSSYRDLKRIQALSRAVAGKAGG